MSVYITREMVKRDAGERKRDKVFSIFQRFARSVARRWLRHRTVTALAAMDDALLRDIGIHRADIGRVVDGLDGRDPGLSRSTATATPKKRPARDMQAGGRNTASA